MQTIESREKVEALRDEFKARSLGYKATTSLESIEWARLHVDTRVILLLSAGIDGEKLHDMALKNWHEFPRPEALRINIEVRRLRSELLSLVALARHV